jgi:anti-anti-sigma factor
MTSNTVQHEPLRAAQMQGPGELILRSERNGDIHAIQLFGELDLTTTAELERAVARVEADRVEEIVLDLSGLEFIDSTGIAFLLAADSRSRPDTHRLTLRRGPAAVHRVFELCAVDALLPFEG